jgi:3-carboxy-cis,cis-muconate cycloisomerase
MRANLDASGGLLMAEHVAAELAPTLGRLAAHDLVAAATARAAEQGTGLAEALRGDPDSAAALAAAGIGESELAVALDPAAYLGATAEFIGRALAAHEADVSASQDSDHEEDTNHGQDRDHGQDRKGGQSGER